MHENIDIENEQRALHIAAALKPYADGTPLTKPAIADLVKELGLSRSVIFRMRDRLKKYGTVSSLIPNKPGRKPMSRFISAQHETLIEKDVLKNYLSSERISRHLIYLRICAAFRSAGLKPVDKSTILRRMDEISPRKVVAKRKGAAAARDEYDLIRGQFTVDRPLRCVALRSD